MTCPSGSHEQLGNVIRRFSRAAPSYDDHAEVYRQIAGRLHARLDLLAIVPGVVLELGCGTGQDLTALRSRYRKAIVLGLDVSIDMLRLAARRTGRWRGARLTAGDAHQLPLPADSVDLVVSNLLLPWCDPHQVFTEIYRVLAPGGTVLFSTFGLDTLIEYRALWQQIDTADHCFGLTDMHDLGDSMLAAGFVAPVLDRENLFIDYPSVDELQAEVRLTGGANVATERRRGLMSPSVSSGLRCQLPAGERFVVTLELVQGHAWKGDTGTRGRTASGSVADNGREFRISLELLKKGLRRGKKTDRD